MIVHDFNPVLIDFGIFEIKWYSIAYIAGILFGWMYANRIIRILEVKKYKFTTIKPAIFDDLILYLILGIILFFLIPNRMSN